MLTRTAVRAGRSVFMQGVGVVDVTRKQAGTTVQGMGSAAVLAALADAGVAKEEVGGVYAGNMLAGMLSDQQHVSTLIASAAGLDGTDTITAENCCGSGGAALRLGYMAVSSGMVDTAVVVGVEQMTHVETPRATKALAAASHWGNEGANGATFVTLNGALHTLYNARYPDHADFSFFPVNAHANALSAQHAVLKKELTAEMYRSSRLLSEPIRLMDASPMCDGAAAVVLSSRPQGVQVLASASASDLLTVAQRPQPLELRGVRESTRRALAAAALTHADVDAFELHDAYAIMACLSLEASGFAPPGEGAAYAAENCALGGRLPICSFGGLKARGHPVGASGVYQAAEAYLQLTRRAGANQIVKERLETALVQSIGGAGSSVFTHVLGRV